MFAPLLTDLIAALHPTWSPGTPAPQALLGAQQRAFGQVLVADAGAQQRRLERADQALLDGLAQSGHVPAMQVRVVAISGAEGSGAGHEATLEPIRQKAAAVVLAVDGDGRMMPLVPSAGPTDWQDQAGSVWAAHAFGLLHEAAHVVQHEWLAHPFASAQVSPTVAADLNAFLIGPLATINGFFRKIYSELFADVYGTMLLATVAPDHPDVALQVAQVIQTRAQNRIHDAEPLLIQRQLLVSLPHLTDRAVAQVWADRSQWQGRTPADLVAQAQRYASDAWLALVRPGRALGTEGVVLDDRLVRVAGRELEENFEQGPAPALAGHAAVDPASSRLAQWQAAYPDHPVLALAVRELGKLQVPGQIPYAQQPAEDRPGLATDFIYAGMLRRGHDVRQDLAQRAQALTAALTQPPVLEASPAPRRRVRPR